MTRILGEDLVFDLDGLLTNRHGANLRNCLAHGLLDWVGADVTHAAYLWWITLHVMFRLRAAESETGFLDDPRLADSDANRTQLAPLVDRYIRSW